MIMYKKNGSSSGSSVHKNVKGRPPGRPAPYPAGRPAHLPSGQSASPASRPAGLPAGGQTVGQQAGRPFQQHITRHRRYVQHLALESGNKLNFLFIQRFGRMLVVSAKQLGDVTGWQLVNQRQRSQHQDFP